MIDASFRVLKSFTFSLDSWTDLHGFNTWTWNLVSWSIKRILDYPITSKVCFVKGLANYIKYWHIFLTSNHICPNNSHTIRTGRSEVATTRSTIANDLNLQGWFWSHKLESLCCKTFEWDLKVTSKAACVGLNPRREGVCGFGVCMWLCQ